MTVQIGHAVMDENGEVTGPVVGDQTGKEVQISKWYAKNNSGIGWSHYFELKDAKKREQLAQFIEAACKNDGIGYSRPNRSMLYTVMKSGVPVSLAKASVDCTSLIFIGLKLACGIDIAIGYSGNMARLLTESGQFACYTDAAHLDSDDLAKRGGIYMRKGHALTVLSKGSNAQESSFSRVRSIGTIYVRVLPGVNNKILYMMKDKEELPYLGTDESSKWYRVQTPKGIGFVTNKPRYTRLV